jgi:hypothetical protein
MKKREIVLITIFLVMLANAAYYLMYFAPIYAESVQLERLNAERTAAIETAIQDLLVYQAVSQEMAGHKANFGVAVDDVPLEITHEEFIRRVDRIVTSRSRELRIQLAEDSGGRRGDESSGPAQTLAISIEFKANYLQLQNVLADFAREDIANRISDISLTEDSELPGTYDIAINAEFLTRSEYDYAPAAEEEAPPAQ